MASGVPGASTLTGARAATCCSSGPEWSTTKRVAVTASTLATNAAPRTATIVPVRPCLRAVGASGQPGVLGVGIGPKAPPRDGVGAALVTGGVVAPGAGVVAPPVASVGAA